MPDETEVSIRVAVNNYLQKDMVSDFAKWPTHQKLTLFTQKTPQKYIKERTIDGKKVKYVPYQFSRKFLNFIFNFNISNEVLKEEYREYEEEFFNYTTKKKEKRHVIEAEATIQFTFKSGDQEMIRTVKAGHKQYPNKALMRVDAMKSAFSKSWTLAAQTFGICAELEKDPDEVVFDDEDKNQTPAPPKDFIDHEYNPMEGLGF